MWGGGQELVPFLKVYRDGEVVNTICLQGKDTWVLGRHNECDIQVGHLSASRQHIEIQVVYATLELLVTDLQSVHGTRVNGDIVKARHTYVLKSNDVIQLGDSSEIFKVEWVCLSEACEIQAEGTRAATGAESALSTEAITDRILEHPSDTGCKAKFIYKLNHGSRSAARRKARRQKNPGTTSSSEEDEPEGLSTPLHPVKSDDNAASVSQIFEDHDGRSTTKKQTRRTTPEANSVYKETDTSSARKPLHQGDEEGYHGTGARRLAFATLQPSDLNIRMGAKPNLTPDKRTPTKAAASKNLTSIKAAPTAPVEEEEVPSPILSLQQAAGSSITAQVLRTEDKSDVDGEPQHADKALLSSPEEDRSEEDTIESALAKLSLGKFGADDEYHHSDKENMPVHKMFMPGPGGRAMRLWGSDLGNVKQEALQTLYSAPSPSIHSKNRRILSPTTASPASYGSMSFGLPWQQHCERARDHVESGGRRWHMVVDTNCLLDAEALKSLRQLEGVRKIRLVIPNVVVRELDCLRRQEKWKTGASVALQWIEDCMVKMPFWIHVQSSSETMQLATSPPASPSVVYSRSSGPYVGVGDLMSPNPRDHVLECALLVHERLQGGRVALLTEDTALKIKAMAEGLEVDSIMAFSDSLLNPYSTRFVYAGSTPIERSSCRRCRGDGLTQPLSPTTSSWSSPPSARSSFFPPSPAPAGCSPRPNWREEFLIRHNCRPRGLQVLLT